MPRLLTILFFFAVPLLLRAALPTARIVNTTIPPAPDGQRFLFLVDISSGMERLQPEVEATVYELIRSGIGGYMRAGDTYGIWTFNKQAYPGRFPMQVWDPRKVSPLGAIAAAFLSEQTYERSSNLKQAITSIGPVVRAVSNLNVLIVSDGGSSIRGTPFDDAINADYRKKSRDRKDSKRPFITTLIVRDGWFVNNSVRIAGQDIPMPDRPLPEIAAAKTNSPPVAKTPPAGKGKVVEHTALVDVIPNPKAQQTSSVPGAVTAQLPKEQAKAAAVQAPDGIKAQDNTAATNALSSLPGHLAESLKPQFVQITTNPSSLPTNALAAVQPATAVIASEPSPNAGADATSAVAAASSTLTPPQAVEKNPAAQQSVDPAVQASAEPSLSVSGLAALSPLPIPVAARELNSEPTNTQPAVPAMQAVTTPTQSGLSGGFMMAFGGVLLAAALFLLLVSSRRFRPAPQGSLITQSMDTQTMQRR